MQDHFKGKVFPSHNEMNIISLEEKGILGKMWGPSTYSPFRKHVSVIRTEDLRYYVVVICRLLLDFLIYRLAVQDQEPT